MSHVSRKLGVLVMTGVLLALGLTGGPISAAWAGPGFRLYSLPGTDFILPNCDGRQEEFYVNEDGSVDHRWELISPIANQPQQWSWWYSLGGTVQFREINAARSYGDCKIELFGVGTDGEMYSIWQNEPNGGGGWSSWASLGGPYGVHFISAPYLFFDANRLGIRAQASDGLYWYDQHTQPYGSPWTGWHAATS